MKSHKAVSLIIAATLIGSGFSARAQSTPNTPNSAAEAVALDRAFQGLYSTASGSLVHISVTQSAAAVLDASLKGEFDDWRKTSNNDQQGRGGRGGGGGGRGANGPGNAMGSGSRGDVRGNDQGNGPGGPFGGRGGFNQNNMSDQVGRFLRWKSEQLPKTLTTASEKEKDATRQQIARLRGLALRVELNRNGVQGDMYAAVIDDAGHAILLTGLLREAHQDPIPVTLPSGKETTAKFIGASLYSGFTVIELANHDGVKPATWSARRLAPGQLLLSFTANQGVAEPLLASMRPGGSGALEDHLAVPAEDRGGIFLFDTTGNLSVVMAGGGGWQGERRSLYGERIQRDINYIISQGKDIEPRPLGVSFSADKGPVHRGVVVTNIDDKSPTRDSGLMKNDLLVSIDGKPVADLISPEGHALPGLLQVQLDLATRTGTVPLVVIRADKEQTLQMTLK